MNRKKIGIIGIIIVVVLIVITIYFCKDSQDSVFTTYYEGGKYNIEKKVNTPKLASGMKAVKWINEEIISIENPKEDSTWYDYENKQWANAMTEDGSLWIWIPRYAYQIENGYHTKDAGKINVKFLISTTNEAEDITPDYSNISGNEKWIIHPAFSNTKSSLGIGCDMEIEGFWVAKFEAAQGDVQSNIKYGTNGTKTNLKVNTMGTKMNYPIFKAGMPSVNYTNSNDMYVMSRSLTVEGNPYGFNSEEIDSMQITNTQWGAIAYLTQSKYGTNGEELEVNEYSLEGITKNATAQTGGENYIKNVKQSSTFNVYGIYDLSGGAWERVSAILDNNHKYLQIYDYRLVKNKDTRYVDKYTVAEEDTAEKNYQVNSNKYGDAMWEVSNSSEGNNAWNNDCSIYPTQGTCIIRRGGNYLDGEKAGIFATYISAGCETNANSSYRVTLINN